MKLNELMTKSSEELQAHIRELSDQIAQERFALRAGSTKQTHVIASLRKERAQAKTLLEKK